MSATADRTSARPDTEDMVIVHNCFRRQFGNAPGLIRSVPAGDGERAGAVAGFLGELLDGLHHHHTTEDDYLWPLLLSRVMADAELVLRMEEQHGRVDLLTVQIRELSLRFAETASTTDGAELADQVEQLTSVLTEHLMDEEQHILPLCERVLSVPEWRGLGEHAQAGIPKDKLLVQLGWLLDSADPRQRRVMLSGMPWIARVLWRLIGRRQWKAEYRRVYLVDPA